MRTPDDHDDESTPDPATSAECLRCGGPATETFGGAYICDECADDLERDEAGDADPDETGADPDDGAAGVDETPTLEPGKPASAAPYDGETADPDAAAGGLALDEWLDREQWECRVEKMPYAPWVDPTEFDYDAHGLDPDEDDPRWKWKPEYDHWRDGWTAHRAAARDLRADGVAYLMQPDDGLVFADGDNVVCPETGERHPAWSAFLEQMPETFIGPSSSGTGDHAVFYCPEGLPTDAEREPVLTLDTEAWGANDDPPKIELYDGTKVMALTGEQRPGTPGYLARLEDTHRDALRGWLEAHDALGDGTDDRPDPGGVTLPDDYEPSASSADETTDEIRDVLTAVNRLTVADLPVTVPSAVDDDGNFTYHDPPYRTSDTGKSLHLSTDGTTFYDHEGGSTFGPLDWFAYRRGRLVDPRDQLTGGDWWDAVDAAREAGAPIPEYVGGRSGDDTKPVAVLPSSPRRRAVTGGWDWTADDRPGVADDRLSLEGVRDAVCDAIADAYERGDRVLVDTLPTTGKSYGAVAAAAEASEPITLLTGRGQKEQYAQFAEWCDEEGLEYAVAPNFLELCDSANGEHGDAEADRIHDLYEKGATGQHIHKHADPRCQQTGGQCAYSATWSALSQRLENDEIDVLIGHYNHAHVPSVVQGRTLVLDEFPGDAYETTLGGDYLASAVTRFLQRTTALPYDDYTDLLEGRTDDDRRADALAWFDDNGVARDEGLAFEPDGHAVAPLAVATILYADDLGNGVERATLGDGRLGVYNREHGSVSILVPPSLDYTSGVVALDGTPTPSMWETVLGTRLNHRQVLSDDERAEYVRETLGLHIVRTTDAIKSYAAGADEIHNRVTVDEDRALFAEIGAEHGEKPALISTKRALGVYESKGVLEQIGAYTNHGNVLGSNKFDDCRLGVVAGSRNFGPDYVKKWGAYLGETVEPAFPGEDGVPLEAGASTDYGPVGNEIRTFMREDETLQAVMRFGRDGGGAVVYTHTNTLPEWVPVAGEARVVHTRSEGERQVIEAARARDGAWTTAEIAADPAVGIGERQVRTHLHRLADRGVVDVTVEGCGFVWRDDGLHRVNDHGDVDLEPVDAADLGPDESAEVARMTTYRWDFRTSATSGDESSLAASERPDAGADPALVDGDPPDPPDD